MAENLHENVDILFSAQNAFLEEQVEDTKGASRIGNGAIGNHRKHIS